MDEPGDHKSPAESERSGELASWYAMAGAGMEFVIALLVPGGIGYWLDSKFDTRPWLLVVGFGIGFAYGLYSLVRMANRTFKN